jgi:hypothetical protein
MHHVQDGKTNKSVNLPNKLRGTEVGQIRPPNSFMVSLVQVHGEVGEDTLTEGSKKSPSSN